jgi:uncharacterized protein YgiM (DUF1202 family)
MPLSPGLMLQNPVMNPVRSNREVSASVEALVQIQTYIKHLEITGASKDSFIESAKISMNLWDNILNFSGDKRAYKASILRLLAEEKKGRSENVITALDAISAYVKMLQVSDEKIVTKDTTRVTKNLFEMKSSPAEGAAPIQKQPVVVAQASLKPGIKYISADTSVNLRTTPVISEWNILRTLPRNKSVELLEYGKEWSLVKDENGEGYMKTSFLRDANHSDLARESLTVNSATEQRTVSVSHSLFVRQKPTVLSEIKGVLYR